MFRNISLSASNGLICCCQSVFMCNQIFLYFKHDMLAQFWPIIACLQGKGRTSFNTLMPRQNGRHFADAIFKCIFMNENVSIAIEMSLKFLPKGRINNIPTLVQIMAWRRQGDKPLSEPVVVSLLTHICVTRPQWVNHIPSTKSRRNRYISIHFVKIESFETWAIWLALENINLQMQFYDTKSIST